MDTHADVHVAAALDPIGGLLGVREFPATASDRPPDELAGGFGTVAWSGSKERQLGAGLARYITTAGVRVVEVYRSDRQDAAAGQSTRSTATARPARARRAGLAARPRSCRRGRGDPSAVGRQRSGGGGRIQTIYPVRALFLTGPVDLRALFAGQTAAALVAGLASLRPRPDVRRLRHPHRAARAGGARYASSAPRRVHRPPRRCPRPRLLSLSGRPLTARALIAAGPPDARSAAGAPAAPPPSRHPRHAPLLSRQANTRGGSVHSPGSSLSRLRRRRTAEDPEESPLPLALRRPRGLSPPPHHRHLLTGAAWLGIRALRLRNRSRGTTKLAERDLIRAFPTYS